MHHNTQHTSCITHLSNPCNKTGFMQHATRITQHTSRNTLQAPLIKYRASCRTNTTRNTHRTTLFTHHAKHISHHATRNTHNATYITQHVTCVAHHATRSTQDISQHAKRVSNHGNATRNTQHASLVTHHATRDTRRASRNTYHA